MLQSKKILKIDPFTTDVFTIPFKDGYILYIPQMGIVAGVDVHVYNLIHAIAQGKPVKDNRFHREWINVLSKLRVFESKQKSKPEELEEFRPTHVTLSLTSRCHLQCVYCYARAGENITDMDEEIMSTALTLVADNVTQKDEHSFEVSFHGEGEPTANWNLFQRAVMYAEQLANDRSLNVIFSMSTNAMWSRSQREFIAQHFQDLSISLDGPPEIQNQQRPTAKGALSFPIVFDNLKFLETAGIQYGIRATVLPSGLDSMIPFLNMIATELQCDWAHFEPVFLSGRAANLNMDTKSFFRSFVDRYHKAVVHGGELGIHVAYSGCRGNHYSAHFCGVSGPNPNFFVSTGGIVSSCYEIIDPTSIKGRFTVYGRYDRTEHHFILDQQKLQHIRGFGVQKKTHCRNCFARWNCSGDCFARSDIIIDEHGNVIGSQQSPRCLANRETTLYDLVRRAVMIDKLSRTKSPAASKKGGELCPKILN